MLSEIRQRKTGSCPNGAIGIAKRRRRHWTSIELTWTSLGVIPRLFTQPIFHEAFADVDNVVRLDRIGKLCIDHHQFAVRHATINADPALGSPRRQSSPK